MDRLTSLRVFREVVEAGSFSAAADRLSLSAPMASKHVAELEQTLGARLLHRSSRHLSLTEVGEAYYEQCRQALETLDAAESAIGESAATPRGELKVSAPVWCANPHFAQALFTYRQRYPEVVVDIRLENRKVDLVADGIDLALRGTWDPSPTLIARPLCKVPFCVVGTPAYLQRLELDNPGDGPPRIGAILPSYMNFDKAPPQTGIEGQPLAVPPAVLRTDDTTLMYHSVLTGMGVAYLPEWLIGDDLAKGRLVKMPRQPNGQQITLFAVYVSRRHLPPKLRTFIDFLSEVFSGFDAAVATQATPAPSPH